MKRLLLAPFRKLFGYVSGDELERADARDLPYTDVLRHPVEVGTPGPHDIVVFDHDNALFGDRAAVRAKAAACAAAGATVGVHAYDADDPRLAELAALANVVVGKTHRDVLETLGIPLPPADAQRVA